MSSVVIIIDGIIHIGIDKKVLDYLATGDDIVKASRWDLPVVLATGKSAATTVAATMIASELAGIRVLF